MYALQQFQNVLYWQQVALATTAQSVKPLAESGLTLPAAYDIQGVQLTNNDTAATIYLGWSLPAPIFAAGTISSSQTTTALTVTWTTALTGSSIPVVGQRVSFNGTGTALDGQVFQIASGVSGTTFVVTLPSGFSIGTTLNTGTIQFYTVPSSTKYFKQLAPGEFIEPLIGRQAYANLQAVASTGTPNLSVTVLA